MYNRALDFKIPATFAICYIVTVTALNAINTKRGSKPYGFSKSRPFKLFVLGHNAVLALYSLVTCVAMVRAVSASWPGMFGEHGLPGAVDALCKINGPRGLGDAVTYNSSTSAWASKNVKILLGEDLSTPDSTDVGRIWNEGLSFWGWLFYMSKFYEVVDNLIILAKGKRASTLQVYHHAGALICMWAGIRYMSPPIWMFVLVNSGIHTLMVGYTQILNLFSHEANTVQYTYYTFCTVGVRAPKIIKQTITSLQITQFVVGLSFAAAHLFISYSVPVSIPYTVKSILSGLPSAAAITSSIKSAFDSAQSTAPTVIHSAASDVSVFASEASSFLSGGSSTWSSAAVKATDSGKSMAESLAVKATNSGASLASSLAARATDSAASLAHKASDEASTFAVHASATMSALASKALADDALWLKKLMYRAVGREALAEAVRNHEGELFGPEFDENLIPRTIEDIKEHVIKPRVEEIKEEVLYRHEFHTVRCLDTDGQAFAIWLNVAYLLPLIGLFLNFFRRSYSGKKRTLSESAQDASRKTQRAVNTFGRNVEGKLSEAAQEGAEELHLEENLTKAKKQAKKKAKAAQKQVQSFNAEETFERVKKEATHAYERVKEEAEETYEKVVEGATHIKNNIVDAMNGADVGEVVEREHHEEGVEEHDLATDGSDEEEDDDQDDDDDEHGAALPHTPDHGSRILQHGELEAGGTVTPGMKTVGGESTNQAVLVDDHPGKLNFTHSKPATSGIPVKKTGGASGNSSVASSTNLGQAHGGGSKSPGKSPGKSPKKKHGK